MKRGDRITLRIDGLAFGGDAVGRAEDGRVVFVARGAPGDELCVVIDEAKRDFGRATIAEIVRPGPTRVSAPCPLVERCGGCQWQSVSLAAQRAAKQEIVERAIGRLGVPIDPLRTPSEPWGYRTRARFTVGAEGAIGFQEQRSHRIVEVSTCPLLDPALDRALAEARSRLVDHISMGGTIAGLVGRGGAVHLAISGVRASGNSAVRALVGTAGIAGAIVDGELFGEPAIDTAVDSEDPFFASADGFAQASRSGNQALRSLVAELARADGRRVLELHAGDGNFTRDLAERASSILAVEGNAEAVARLRRNVPRATAHAEPVERAAERLAASGERFDLALIDPPRAGAKSLLKALSILTPRLVYVSCDPMTLARDLRELTALGLAPVRAAAIDMMPHTFHVEVVVELARR